MKFSFAAALAILATAVSAQQNIVSITSPLTGTVFQAGSYANISWIEPTVYNISKITLVKGNPNALQPVLTVARNVNADAGTYIWDIPSNISGGTDYALELGTSPNISFTGLFTIENYGDDYNSTGLFTTEDYGDDYNSTDLFTIEDYGDDYNSTDLFTIEDYGDDYNSTDLFTIEDYGDDYNSTGHFTIEDYGDDYNSTGHFTIEDYGDDYNSTVVTANYSSESVSASA